MLRVGMRCDLSMKLLNVVILLLAAGMAPGMAPSQDSPAMAPKEQGGVPLGEVIEDGMCAADGVAVGGYDLVSYRSPGGPVLGFQEHAASHQDRTYLFVNEGNRDEFLSDPERYLPSYGGFCAITLALGRVTCPDYTNFKIEDDRLLLFETTGFTNGRVVWDTDPAGFKEQADSNFQRIKAVP